MKIAILIPIYNRLETTKRGLAVLAEALKQAGRCTWDTVVIDDGSSDGSAAWIETHYPSIRLLHGDGNLWWSGCINRGAAYAMDTLGADYLLLWNDDIEPAPGYFAEAERVLLAGGLEDTVIGSKILSRETQKIWSIGGYFHRVTGRYGMYTDPAGASGFFDCDWLPGMGTFVPTAAIRRYGVEWDEKKFPQYHGDSAFTLQCKQKGMRVSTCLSLSIYNAVNRPTLKKMKTFGDLWKDMTSMRSNYNLRNRLNFHNRFGIPPFSYIGLMESYALYIGSFVKRKLLKH